MFPASSTSCPSFVTDFAFTNTFNASFSSANAFAFASYSLISSSVGLIITFPSTASKIIVSPWFTADIISPQPTTAGISKEFAIIAEWLVFPPIEVAKPFTKWFNCAVSDGVKS